MNQKLITIIGVLTFAAAMLAAVILHNFTAPPVDEPQLSEVVQVPNITITDAHGSYVELSSFFGTPIVLNFWTTWCRFCVIESPHFEELYATHGDVLQIVKLNTREARTTVDRFMEANGYTFPVFFDYDGSAANTFRVRGVPITIFINAQGEEVWRVSGAVTAQSMATGVGLITQD